MLNWVIILIFFVMVVGFFVFVGIGGEIGSLLVCIVVVGCLMVVVVMFGVYFWYCLCYLKVG